MFEKLRMVLGDSPKGLELPAPPESSREIRQETGRVLGAIEGPLGHHGYAGGQISIAHQIEQALSMFHGALCSQSWDSLARAKELIADVLDGTTPRFGETLHVSRVPIDPAYLGLSIVRDGSAQLLKAIQLLESGAPAEALSTYDCSLRIFSALSISEARANTYS
jgi:hypothetical protein